MHIGLRIALVRNAYMAERTVLHAFDFFLNSANNTPRRGEDVLALLSVAKPPKEAGSLGRGKRQRRH